MIIDKDELKNLFSKIFNKLRIEPRMMWIGGSYLLGVNNAESDIDTAIIVDKLTIPFFAFNYKGKRISVASCDIKSFEAPRLQEDFDFIYPQLLCHTAHMKDTILWNNKGYPIDYLKQLSKQAAARYTEIKQDEWSHFLISPTEQYHKHYYYIPFLYAVLNDKQPDVVLMRKIKYHDIDTSSIQDQIRLLLQSIY